MRLLLERLKGGTPVVNLYMNTSFLKIQGILQAARKVVVLAICLSILFALLSLPSIASFFEWVILSLSLYYCYKLTQRLIILYDKKFPLDSVLLEVLATNDLVDEELALSASLSYEITPEEIIVVGLKDGSKFVSKLEELDKNMESALKVPLNRKVITHDRVEYHFLLSTPTRKKISSLPMNDSQLKIQIYKGFEINLRNNYSMLLSGASGSGKSYFTYFFLTRFISQTLEGKHAKLYIIDPKRSDLYKLARTAGLPEEMYGTSNSEAFQIVREYLSEMNRRMELYDQSLVFDSVGIDIGLEPTLLIVEEYSSLIASFDNKQKKEFENMVAIIAQKARSLSMGLLLVMQQPRSDSLSTNIREQLSNSIFLGNPSREAAGMMFGTTEIPTVTGKGAGSFSIERAAPQPFESPQFKEDVFDTILPVWKHAAASYHSESSPPR
ncbi:FtsK/SpoIIIE domain-containing protein [Weissella confusa]|uniref:FtsK/SpoIIIE domain-containing protein n=1 Tax=Weissella confusa TaxID=1583 RepID=UPI001F5B063A|nr:FtsK/SpoIIIE domain-containing protein [Weissella confusa]